MATLQELRSQVNKLRKENEEKRRKLRNRAESGRDLKRIQEERKRLERELKNLKNPRSAEFKRNLRRGAMKTGKGLMNFLESVAETEQPRKKQPVRRKPVKKSQRRQRDPFANISY